MLSANILGVAFLSFESMDYIYRDVMAVIILKLDILFSVFNSRTSFMGMYKVRIPYVISEL